MLEAWRPMTPEAEAKTASDWAAECVNGCSQINKDGRDGHIFLSACRSCIAETVQRATEGLRSLLGVREEEIRRLQDAFDADSGNIGILTNQRGAAREQMRLNAEALEATKADHHAPGRWTTCSGCVQFFRQDEEGAAENARLREHRSRLQEHNTELIERARVAELALNECRAAILDPGGWEERCRKAEKALAEMTAMHADVAAKACRNERELGAVVVEALLLREQCDKRLKLADVLEAALVTDSSKPAKGA